MSSSKVPNSSERMTVSKRFGRASEAEDRLLLELGKKYRILALLGEGGTARVWLALARGPSGFNKLVVLKTIRGELFDNESVVGMFLEEARLAARLNHPNIVQTNEVFEQDRHPVIVMEYLDGLPFSAILERQREGSALALAMLLRIVSDALSGLHAAHDLKDYDGTPLSVVHRDVSPHNLFVTFAGEVKVLDFGIAQINASGETTNSGVLKGKLRYMAPEQIEGESTIDRRADIYAMGVVLWELATAKRMWSGVSEPTITKRILAGDLPRAREVNPDMDAQLEEIIEKTLSRRPEDRFRSALAFQTAVDRYMATLGGALRSRDIGRAVSKMFEDERDERRLTIEHQLARSDTLHDIQLREAPLPELTSFSNVEPQSVLRRYRASLGPHALVILALLAMAVFGFTLFGFDANKPPSAGNREDPSSPVEPRELKAGTPQTVALRITAFPQSARLSLNGNPLLSNPHANRFPRDREKLHELIVEAPGYRTESRTLVFDIDQELVLTLHRLEEKDEGVTKAATPPRKAQKPKPRTKTDQAAADEVTQKKPDCSTPHFFDDRGVKKYRPECL